MPVAPEAAVPSPLLRFTGIRLVHTALRRDLAPMPGRIRSPHGDGRAAGTDVLAQWRLVARILMAHHEYEDTHLWPVLRACRPELRLLLNRLEADHHRLDHDLGVVTAMIGGLAHDPERAWMVAAAVEAVIETIDAHLRVEEVQVLPELAAVVEAGGHIGTLGASLAAIDAADVFDTGGRAPADAITWLLDGIAGAGDPGGTHGGAGRPTDPTPGPFPGPRTA
ncbi:hemerythrin domain-containing protein [Embleya sp. NBC_00896]|uniref:hemerythrin domain-containing protein n=1 Tax=Embleya sp. NBC_00896 TaxID=2975961 RepID=UPI003869E6EB|nr:hemerythrin domain-containing protein [Embleya sp. NBC_00896]